MSAEQAPPRKLPRVLVVVSSASVPDVVRPVLAAISALELEVRRVDVGRAFGARPGYRVLEAIVGDTDARRLESELASFAPDVAVAFDPPVARALAIARDRRVARTPVVAVVSELAPRREWRMDADRYVVVDDDAAVALSDLGVDGARVITVGPPVSREVARAGREDKIALRDSFSLPREVPVVLVVAHDLPTHTLSQVVIQLGLLSSVFALFDAGADRAAAGLLRQKVPGVGLRAKLFGATEDAPRLWRAADVVVARPTPQAILRALAAGCAFVALEPEAEDAEVRALFDRGMGVVAHKALLLATVLEPLVSSPALRTAALRSADARRSEDAAAAIADLVRKVAAERDLVLEETFAGQREATPEGTAKEPSSARPGFASGLEDLGDDEPFSPPPGPTSVDDLQKRVMAARGAAEARARKELDEARTEAERWEARRVLAEQKGDARLAADAAREADRKRARMHMALAELERLAEERRKAKARVASASSPSLDETLAALKHSMRAERTSVDDQLSALKKRVEAEKKKGKR